jgi:LemA protein
VFPRSSPHAQGAPFIKDEVYFSIARKLQERSDSPVSAIVAALGDVIEVTSVTPGADGKVTAVVKEITPSTARATNRSIKVVFARDATKDKWVWEQFEDNRRLYEVDKLFPYAKERLEKSKQAAEKLWANLIGNMNRVGEAAMKVVETATAVMKKEPLPAASIATARTAVAEATKKAETEPEGVGSSHRDLERAVEPILTMADNFPELKTNDAYLRLLEEMKAVQNSVKVTRKAYLDAIDVYNDDIKRLPFALVAYGMEFTKLEAKIQPEEESR